MRERQVKEKRRCAHMYAGKTKEAWRADFIAQYHRHKPASAALYNSRRDKESPAWISVAKMFGIQKWRAWLCFCEIAPCTEEKISPRVTRAFQIPGKPAFSAYLQERLGTNREGKG